jgi:hypothetical protein
VATKHRQSLTRLGLALKTERDANYLHVTAHPVTIGLTAVERAQIDTGHSVRGDVNSSTVRSCSDDLVNGLYLANLRVWSQGNNDDRERHLYGFELRYMNLYAVELRDAKRMFKTLNLIEARIESLAKKYGRPTTFGQYLARVADAIGADTFVRQNGRFESDHVMDITTGIYHVDALVREWVTERETKAAS